MYITKYRKPSIYANQLFENDDFFSPFNDMVRSVFGRDTSSGLVNVSETEKDYSLDFVLPGYKKDDIKIEINDGVLTISAENKAEKEDKGKNYLRKEYVATSFSRSFSLPDDVNTDDVNAEMVDGILKLKVKKLEEEKSPKVKSIEIK